jgi:hypothetical protein
MIWWQWTFAAIAVGYLGFVIRCMWQDHDAWMKQHRKQREKIAWDQACEERRLLEDALKRAPFKPLIVPYESPWDYTRRCADMGCIKLKPWEPSWNYMRMLEEINVSVHATISVKVWITEIDGLFHRVGKLPLDNGQHTPVLLCNPNVRVETDIVEYARDMHPLINCLMCIATAKD